MALAQTLQVRGGLKALYVRDLSILATHRTFRLYSAFQALHAALKDQYPEVVEPFRFPHKSMFNTFSNYTKERRRQGFDDFLKLLVSLEPLPMEVARFLELDDHVWPHAASMPQHSVPEGSAPAASNNGASASASRKPSTPSPAPSSGPESGRATSIPAPSSPIPTQEPTLTTDNTIKEPLTGKDVLKTMKSTFLATIILYTLSIVLGIFDIKKSSAGKLIYEKTQIFFHDTKLPAHSRTNAADSVASGLFFYIGPNHTSQERAQVKDRERKMKLCVDVISYSCILLMLELLINQ
jgi:hypothetical protein